MSFCTGLESVLAAAAAADTDGRDTLATRRTNEMKFIYTLTKVVTSFDHLLAIQPERRKQDSQNTQYCLLDIHQLYRFVPVTVSLSLPLSLSSTQKALGA